jgi:UDP-N-acetylmuramyl pentapeptide phosphotransferase/UDP-N-acetylglucosamine-1-phosphate transferase
MPDYSIWIIASSILTSFFAVQWIYFKVLKIAKVKNLVDKPDGRKLQKSYYTKKERCFPTAFPL